jgi:nitrous oxidase accessory protein NosD
VFVELASQAVPSSGALVEYYVQPGLSPLVAVEDSVNVTIDRLTLQDGAIAYLATRPIQAALTISGCRISNGQIRIQGRHNTVPQFVNQATSNELDGPRDIRIYGNRITGTFAGVDKRRYIKFTERVHGIVVAGGASGIDVRDNEVSGAAGDGLFLQSAVGGSVRNNKLVGNALSGIGLENTSVRRSRGLQIVGNVGNENWFDGCDLNYGDPRVMDCSRLSLLPRGETAEHYFADNEFVGNGGDMPELSGGCGIYVRWIRGAVFERNACNDNNVSGILCELSEKVEIRKNKFAGNGRTQRTSAGAGLGIGLFGCRSAVVEGNQYSQEGRQRTEFLSSRWTGRCKGQAEPIEIAPG